MRSASGSVLVMGWDLALQFIKKDEAIASRRMESEELIMLIDESKHFLSHELHEFTRIEFVNPHAMVRLRSPTETQRRNWIHNNVIPIIFQVGAYCIRPGLKKLFHEDTAGSRMRFRFWSPAAMRLHGRFFCILLLRTFYRYAAKHFIFAFFC